MSRITNAHPPSWFSSHGELTPHLKSEMVGSYRQHLTFQAPDGLLTPTLPEKQDGGLVTHPPSHFSSYGGFIGGLVVPSCQRLPSLFEHEGLVMPTPPFPRSNLAQNTI